MNDFLQSVQSGSTSLWLFIPSAILLGALHGLEPGHSKTMMAAFIIAIAAWSVQHAQKRFKGFGEAMRRAPYVSCALLVVIAAYMAWHGWKTLPAH